MLTSIPGIRRIPVPGIRGKLLIERDAVMVRDGQDIIAFLRGRLK